MQDVLPSYANASTNAGRVTKTGFDGSFALNADASPNEQAIEDFASRLPVKAKAVATAFYGRVPINSYWAGCSTGGRQGVRAVQQFPGGYDGVLAGASAINAEKFIPAQVWPRVSSRMPSGQT
jgi:hypothetical protein